MRIAQIDHPASQLHPQMLRDRENILVTPPAQIGENDRILVHRRRDLLDRGYRVRWLQRRNDPFGAAQQLERGQCLDVGDAGVVDPADLLEPRMLGADAGIIEPRADRVRLGFIG